MGDEVRRMADVMTRSTAGPGAEHQVTPAAGCMETRCEAVYDHRLAANYAIWVA
jgi:hypothetical protein